MITSYLKGCWCKIYCFILITEVHIARPARLPILPKSMCNVSIGHISRESGGTCPKTTVWDEKLGCCIGCSVCGPGMMKATAACHSGCVPCPDGFFSNEFMHNDLCYPCISCKEKNRHVVYGCGKSHNARCGGCLPWYFEHPDLKGSITIACLQCFPGNKDQECVRYYLFMNLPVEIVPTFDPLDIFMWNTEEKIMYTILCAVCATNCCLFVLLWRTRNKQKMRQRKEV